MSPLRLMGILAHPDDESLGLGGAFARYAAEGVECYLVTATRGERGRYRGLPPGGAGHPGAEELSRIREAELRAAAAILGIREVSLLDYPDGALDRADPRQAIDRIAAHLRRVRPHVVLTFAPDGAYGHPDHIAISQFASAAVVVATDPAHTGEAAAHPVHAVSKLYQMAWPEAKMAAYQEALKKLTSMVDGVEREGQPWPSWAITTVIETREHWPVVWRAVSCHESQIGAYERLRNLEPESHEAIWGSQHFYRAMSTVNGGRARETDLFEGLAR
ncbi:MAG TPA: PIG-L family deacetylase [Candidatus Saccharimonadales bacterium]|nr:PIG-L family deacetylase [Candidatus Saccharimonadales bacterium]